MAAPLLHAQIDINAPVEKVWALVADVRRMPQWSPQCRMMRTLGPVRQGARTVNVNRRGLLVWPTTSRITEFVPEKKLSFRVNENGTIWSYELEPTDSGTRLTETRHAENGVKPVSNMAVNRFMGGVPSFEQELVEGMNQSLARIKAAAES
ncbi:SRPBCC family protein [Mycobacterium deserti]|uniref:SRPBCC family protein n=1 Tax=Mycobacterium deserti TaxID=2978347 RepID=A0ABT2M5N4_9MYCO|nr:SRPBCC family protein [Mycobacterium deserti]MCT7657576.1 SRPBCC family protein [Mycobacterium deserti]